MTKTGITNYDFLKDLPELEGIDISQNNVSDLSFLKEFPKLKSLAAAGNQLTEISVLKSLPQLESLNLEQNISCLFFENGLKVLLASRLRRGFRHSQVGLENMILPLSSGLKKYAFQ